jgi:hypothetical protein
MSRDANPLGEALDEIERSILPGLSGLLDGLLDSAALARPGIDAESYAARLRDTALRIDGLTWLVEAVVPLAQATAIAAPRRISA